MSKKRKRTKPKRINDKLSIDKREGQIGINNQGLEMKITRYGKLEGYKKSTIDVEFLIDNYKIKDRMYDEFLLGMIKNPNFPNARFIDRTGERKQNKQGDWMEIIKCFSNKNNIVRFDDDGSIVKDVNYNNFKNGDVGHPLRFTESLLYLYPKVAESIAIPKNNITLDDCAKITPGSHKKYFVKCFYCNRISSKKKELKALTQYGLSCEYCSDNISIPNKMLRQIAIQLNLNWEFEYSEDWMGNHKFDAYDVDLKQPIEADALFYIRKNGKKIINNHKGKRKEIDNWKDEEAINHDMKLTRRVNLMDEKEYDNNKFEYIKKQVYSAIGDLYDLDKVDWDKAWLNCQNSLVIEACRLWKEEQIYNTKEISDILKLGRGTVTRYLKCGSKLGLCDYSREKSLEEMGKKNRSINHPNANLYWVIKPDGKIYLNKPLCGQEIYNTNSNGFLNITKVAFDKYIEPYNNIDISRIKNNRWQTRQLREKLTPFNGWQFIPLSKEEKQQYLENIL